MGRAGGSLSDGRLQSDRVPLVRSRTTSRQEEERGDEEDGDHGGR